MNARLASVSSSTGVLERSRTRAITWRGSSGASDRSRTVPTPLPLYCTGLPVDSPLTGSLQITSYSRQAASDVNLAAHRANSTAATEIRRGKAQLSTRSDLVSISDLAVSSDVRPVGKEGGRQCRSRWSPCHLKQ